MRANVIQAVLLCFVSACASPQVERIASAERFFRGVYGCDPSVVDDLAAEDIVVTYPVFEELFGAPAIRGREALKQFVAGFCERWTEGEVDIHEVVSDGDKVVLVWSFRARNVRASPNGQPPTNPKRSWGGITLFRFDGAGKIIAEIGEESEPGPAQRFVADDK